MIKNLRLMKKKCEFVAPYILSTGIIIGAFKVLGHGFPFIIDENKKHKLYTLETTQNGNVMITEEYAKYGLFDNLPNSKIIIYTPWEQEGEKYIRTKKQYVIDELTSVEIYYAVLNKDYEYITNNLKDYKEEKQIVTDIYHVEPNDYIIDSKLYVTDNNDTQIQYESNIHNIMITISEIALSTFVVYSISYEKKHKTKKRKK